MKNKLGMASASTSTESTIPNAHPEFLYHYTSHENLKKILKDGKIKESELAKAYVNGSGVYLTAITPDAGSYRIWWNNWGGKNQFSSIFLSPAEAHLKTLCFVKLRTDRLSNVTQITENLQFVERDVWVHRGEITLAGIDSWYSVGFVDERRRLMAVLNQRHGYHGWSHSIKDSTVGCYVENDRLTVYASATVRLRLANGIYHEDIGFGLLTGQPSMSGILQIQAKQECNAVLDGLKRAAQYFGLAEDLGSEGLGIHPGLRTPKSNASSSNDQQTPTTSTQQTNGRTRTQGRHTTSTKRKITFDDQSDDDDV